MKKLSVALGLSLAAGGVHAKELALEEMIVTGSRVQESLDEVPSSVTLIDSETLRQDLSLTTELQNVLATRVAGMAPSTGSSSNFGVTLRGRTALVLIDGVPQSTPLRNGQLDIRSIDPAALERIEVVKGATSIYGNGAAGGIINYITRRPPAEDGFNGEVQVSTRFSTIDTSNSLGGRISAVLSGRQEQFSYVFNMAAENRGVERDADGDIIGTSLYGLSEVDSRNLFAKLGWDFDAEKSLQLTYSYYEAQQNTDLVDVISSINSGQKTYAVESSTGVPGEPQGPDGNHNVVLQYRDDQLFQNTGVSIDAYWQEIENAFFWSTSFADPEAGFAGGNSVIVSEKQGLRINFDSSFHWAGVDTTIIYGVDLLEDVTSQPLADGRSWVPDMDMTNTAGYVQGKWTMNDWVLKAGVRREFITVDVPDYTTLYSCPRVNSCAGGNPVQGGELDYQNTTYNVGLRYNAFEAFQPFASYSEGFDVSDLGLLLRAASVPNLDQVRTEASVVENYEVGFSGRVDRLSYEFAAYQSESELGTRTIETFPGSGIYVPVRSPQEIWGAELAVGYQFNDWLTGGLTYSWVEGENPDTGKYLGARNIFPAKFTAYLDWEPTAKTRLSINYLHVGSRDRFDPVNGLYTGDEAPVSSYDVVNVSGSYRWDAWELTAGIENLLNQDYFSARAQAFTYDGYNTKAIGRTAVLGLSYSF